MFSYLYKLVFRMNEEIVKFEPNAVQAEKKSNVEIWWFPSDFSQSRFGDRNIGSNACTLIAVIVAHRCYHRNIKIDSNPPGNTALVNTFAESIIDGNNIHRKLNHSGELSHVNLTVPEAIQAGINNLDTGSCMKFLEEWKSLVYVMDMESSLYDMLNESLQEWNRNPPRRCGSDLYVILIADHRSVLLVFQRDLDNVTLIDSHQHAPHGAVIAQVATLHLPMLCKWYNYVMQEYYGSRPGIYELSYLYFKSFQAGEIPNT